MKLPFTDRVLRASWQQILLYIAGVSVALKPFITDHIRTWSDFYTPPANLFEVAQIIAGAVLLTIARSPIQRKEWDAVDREIKTYQEGKETPPSK